MAQNKEEKKIISKDEPSFWHWAFERDGMKTVLRFVAFLIITGLIVFNPTQVEDFLKIIFQWGALS